MKKRTDPGHFMSKCKSYCDHFSFNCFIKHEIVTPGFQKVATVAGLSWL